MSRENVDVIVVGGGPAGSATAAHLARAGFSVVVIERAGFPHSKPCGEFFSPPVRGLLENLGVYEAVTEAGIRAVPDAVLCHERGGTARGTFTGANHRLAPEGGFSIERRVLDHLLWENAAAAGAETRQGVAVRGLLRGENGAVGGVRTDSGEITAKLVIGADGSRSRVGRELGLLRPVRRLQKVALVSHFDGVTDVPERASVEMFVAGNYVCGWGPGPHGTVNVTLVVPEDRARSVAAQGAEGFVQDTLATRFPEVAQRLNGATLRETLTCGTHGHYTTSPVADGALLVGDAAAFIDPFTGEGVYFALRSAELAAETAVSALHWGETSARALQPYARSRRRELMPKYAVCEAVERAVHSPDLMRWALPRFRNRPDLLNRILQVTGDMARPETLLRPNFWAAALCTAPAK
ncbi:MAG: geranylgeranyl reductase family protein [Armatimonadaceae bacterium]